MKKLTLLEIGTTDIKGGAAFVSWQIKQKLEEQGHQVNMIVGYKRSESSSVREIYDTPLNNLISRLIKRNFRSRIQSHLGYWLANDITWLPGNHIYKLPEFKKADIIHAHNLHTSYFNLKALPNLSRLKPFVWTLHDMWAFTGYRAYTFDCDHWQSDGCNCVVPDSLPPLKWNNTRHLWRLKNKIYRQSKLQLVVPSQWLYEKVKKSMLKHQPLKLIYNGVDTKIFKPMDKGELRKKINLPTDKKIVLFSNKGGKKFARKGWSYAEKLISNYKENTSILFLCLGGYDETATKQDNIQYVPYIGEPARLAEYYAASDLLLYTSLADNCPLTVLESMACGTPVLSFSTGGIPELITHGQTGYIAKYKNDDDLKKGFERLTSLSEEEASRLSLQCRARAVKHFSLEQMVENYLALYYRILSPKHS